MGRSGRDIAAGALGVIVVLLAPVAHSQEPWPPKAVNDAGRPAPAPDPRIPLAVANKPAPAQVLAGQIAPTIASLRPILRTELRLLDEAAGLSPTQRREIAVEAGRTLRAQVEVQKARTLADFHPRKLVRQHLELASWPRLSNIQSARYRDEQDRKDQLRKEVVILNVAANLDRLLVLSPDQRTRLVEGLRVHWDRRDSPPSETLDIYDDYVPIIAEVHLFPILDVEQRTIWRALRKSHLAAIRANEPLEDVLEVVPGPAEDPDVAAALGGGGEG